MSSHPLAGRRIAIVHYGEGSVLDEGYRKIRLGLLSAALTKAGVEITRLIPTYNQFRQNQRSLDSTGHVGDEGRMILIPTRAFASTRSKDRALSLGDFNRGAEAFFRTESDFDAIIVGFPPPRLISSIRKALGDSVPIVADVRDLWPDAMVPTSRLDPVTRPLANAAGKALAYELRRASAVVAMSETMLKRAPSNAKRHEAIPIGLVGEPLVDDAEWPAPAAPFSAVFVGSLSQLFDLGSMLEGWVRFVDTRKGCQPEPTLTVIGDGEQRELVDQLTKGQSTITTTGWLLSSEVPSFLAQADVGIAPPRTGQGTTLSNKIYEYMAEGLFILNSLEPDEAAVLDKLGLGARCDSTAAAWAESFSAAERETARLRSERGQRVATAFTEFGWARVEAQWTKVLCEVMNLS